jgi:hypothetical protein
VHHVRSNFDAIEQTEEVKRVAPDLLSRLVRCGGRGYCRPTSASLVNKRLFLSHGLVVLDPRVTIYWREHCAASEGAGWINNEFTAAIRPRLCRSRTCNLEVKLR